MFASPISALPITPLASPAPAQAGSQAGSGGSPGFARLLGDAAQAQATAPLPADPAPAHDGQGPTPSTTGPAQVGHSAKGSDTGTAGEEVHHGAQRGSEHSTPHGTPRGMGRGPRAAAAGPLPGAPHRQIGTAPPADTAAEAPAADGPGAKESGQPAPTDHNGPGALLAELRANVSAALPTAAGRSSDVASGGDSPGAGGPGKPLAGDTPVADITAADITAAGRGSSPWQGQGVAQQAALNHTKARATRDTAEARASQGLALAAAGPAPDAPPLTQPPAPATAATPAALALPAPLTAWAPAPPPSPSTETGAAPAEARMSAPPASADFAPQLGAQITTFARQGIEHARLHLNPADMGPVMVQIQLDGQAAQIHMSADHPATRQALEQAMPALASGLREAGLTLAGGGVFEQPQQAQDQAQAQTPGSRQGRAAGAPELAQDAADSAPVLRRRGVVDLVA